MNLMSSKGSRKARGWKTEGSSAKVSSVVYEPRPETAPQKPRPVSTSIDVLTLIPQINLDKVIERISVT